MGDLSTAEHNRDFHLVTFGQELLNEAGLGIEVTVSNFGTVLHLLEPNVDALSTRFLGLLSLVKLELSVVHDSANWRISRGGNLHEV